MDHATQHIAATEADHAFEQLRSEVSLLRRAIEGLAAERQAVPDYAPTLTTMDRLKQIADWARRVAETPLLTLTPATLEQEIARVCVAARQADRDTIARANATMTAAIAGVERVTDSAWTASDQWRALCLTGGISFMASMMLTLSLVWIDNQNTGRPHIASAQAMTAPVRRQQMMPGRGAHSRVTTPG